RKLLRKIAPQAQRPEALVQEHQRRFRPFDALRLDELPADLHAVFTCAAFCNPNSSMDCSRILNFWILPVTVIGNASTNFQYRGILKVEIRPRQYPSRSCSVALAPGFSFTHAITSSPYFSLGTPMTCTSLTAGWV